MISPAECAAADDFGLRLRIALLVERNADLKDLCDSLIRQLEKSMDVLAESGQFDVETAKLLIKAAKRIA